MPAGSPVLEFEPGNMAGDKKTFAVGGLEFEILGRADDRGGPDGGPSMFVYGEVDGKRAQVLRFDCFRVGPHYHLDPDGKNVAYNMKQGADTVGWTIEQVRTRLDAMIRTAGFDALAEQVDLDAIRATASQLEQAMRNARLVDWHDRIDPADLGDVETIAAGGLEFEIECIPDQRSGGRPGGPAMGVFGEVDGTRVKVLQFDIFRAAPHYHLDPEGRNTGLHEEGASSMVHLEEGADNVGWLVEQVRTRLDEMIRTAGFDTLAEQVDLDALRAVAPRLEQALRLCVI